MIKPKMTWVAGRKGWLKEYKGEMYSVSCRQLDVPPTKQESTKAANDWWDRKLDSIKTKPTTFPGLDHLELERDWYTFIGQTDQALSIADEIERYKELAAAGKLSQQDEKDLELRYPRGEQFIHWSERRRIIERVRTVVGERIGQQVQDFLDAKEAEVQAGEIQPTTFHSIRYGLKPFETWFGPDRLLEHIDANTLDLYRRHLIDQITKKKLSRRTAAGRLVVLKQFLRDRWRLERIKDLPRNIDDLSIEKRDKTPNPYTVEEVSQILALAQPRQKLYLLLMLNCGMTQVDIGTLHQHEVIDGRIIRKRTKEVHEKNTPEVNYLLWTETKELLGVYLSKSKKGPALLNASGESLYRAKTANGKLVKTDSIRLMWRRFRKSRLKDKDTGKEIVPDASLKRLRKTGASILNESKEFAACKYLYLGHAPSSIADKHYTPPPQSVFDEAIRYLGNQLGIQ